MDKEQMQKAKIVLSNPELKQVVRQLLHKLGGFLLHIEGKRPHRIMYHALPKMFAAFIESAEFQKLNDKDSLSQAWHDMLAALHYMESLEELFREIEYTGEGVFEDNDDTCDFLLSQIYLHEATPSEAA